MSYAALNADQRGGSAPTGKPSKTIDEAAAILTRAGLSWSDSLGTGTTVTYAYRASAPGEMPSDTSGFTHFNSTQISATEQALQLWSHVANIQFVRVGAGTSGPGAYSNDATILFGGYTAGQAGASGFAYLPGDRSSAAPQGDVWINETPLAGKLIAPGDDAFLTLLHEIGHAIGLSHPSAYDAGANAPTYATDASYNEDSLEYSVMSYFDLRSTGGTLDSYNSPNARPMTPLMDDIAAAQRLYGANLTATSGNTLYGITQTLLYQGIATPGDLSTWGYGAAYGTIWDSGGSDTIDFANSSFAERIDLHAGSFSDVQGGVGTLSIAPGVTIENAVGGYGSDRLIGNGVANLLVGNGGDDLLIGNAGDDTLDGGDGSDRAVIAANLAAASFTVADSGDVLVRSGDGSDTLRGIETLGLSDRDLATASITGTDALYRSYMGRAAGAGEIGYWIGQLLAGGSQGTVRSTILADPFGHAHTLATIDGFYRTDMGRAAQASELAYWETQVKAGTAFDAVQAVILADPGSRAQLKAQVDVEYHEYFGRPATPDELNVWANQLAAGYRYANFLSTLAASTNDSYFVLDQRIQEAYGLGLDRAADSGETFYWHGRLNLGTSLTEMRRVIANDQPVHGSSADAVTALYQTYMGRAPVAGELGYWDDQVRAGAGQYAIRGAILDDGAGRAHTQQLLGTLYQTYFHRAPTAAEVGNWTTFLRDGASFGTAEATIMLDGSTPGIVTRSAGPQNARVAIPHGVDHVVVESFRSFGGDSISGADRDTLDLRNSDLHGDAFATGRASQVTELGGATDVLLTFDGGKSVLLRDTTLAELDHSHFLWA